MFLEAQVFLEGKKQYHAINNRFLIQIFFYANPYLLNSFTHLAPSFNWMCQENDCSSYWKICANDLFSFNGQIQELHNYCDSNRLSEN